MSFTETWSDVQKRLNEVSKTAEKEVLNNFSTVQKAIKNVQGVKGDLGKAVDAGIKASTRRLDDSLKDSEESFFKRAKPFLIGGGVLLSIIAVALFIKK